MHDSQVLKELRPTVEFCSLPVTTQVVLMPFKLNTSNGGPAPEGNQQNLWAFVLPDLKCDIKTIVTQQFDVRKRFTLLCRLKATHLQLK
jgi:hypothetical protein